MMRSATAHWPSIDLQARRGELPPPSPAASSTSIICGL
jgi:hypothetical protein